MQASKASILRLSVFASSPFMVKGLYDYKYQEGSSKQQPVMRILTSPNTSEVNKYVLRSGMQDVVATYKPAWFYFNNCFACVRGALIPSQFANEKPERVYLSNLEEGNIRLDILPKKTVSGNNFEETEKVIILLHGIAGSGDEPSSQEMAGFAAKHGYNVVCFNHHAPAKEKGYRMMDMSKNCYMDEVIEYAKSRFDKAGKPSEIYLVGFSLGGSHSLRYMGNASKIRRLGQKNEMFPDQSNEVSAIVTVSNPWNLWETCIRLQTQHLGLYDKVISKVMRDQFTNLIYKDQDEKVLTDRYPTAKLSIQSIDDVTRTVAWGYKSTRELYDKISCVDYLEYVDKPFMIIYANDDPIIQERDVPKHSITSHQQGLFVESDYGAHMDFFVEQKGSKTKYRRFYPELVIKYLEDVSQFNKRGGQH